MIFLSNSMCINDINLVLLRIKSTGGAVEYGWDFYEQNSLLVQPYQYSQVSLTTLKRLHNVTSKLLKVFFFFCCSVFKWEGIPLISPGTLFRQLYLYSSTKHQHHTTFCCLNDFGHIRHVC